MSNASPAVEAYIPGVCNINRAEIAYRRNVAYIATALTVVLAIILIATSVNRYFRLVAFLPALIAVINFLQVKNHFCVSYAASGQQNASEGSKAAQAIEDAAAKAADKRKARKMNLQATGIAAIVVIILVII